LDTENLKAKAISNMDLGMTQIKQWWSNKYKLPPNHELFLNQSMAEHTQEMYEDALYRRREIKAELEDGDGDSSVLLKQLNALNKLLGEEQEVQDDLFEKWEQQVARGEIPDLDEMPGD
jgi:hypothetical protein